MAISHCASGSAKAFSPTMPLSTPIDVMPICTVDRNLVGVLVQVHRRLGAGFAAFDHHGQPGLAAGGERHLGHGEQAVEQDQQDKQRKVHARRRGLGFRGGGEGGRSVSDSLLQPPGPA